MENSAWCEHHFVVGDDYGCFRLTPNPDGESDTFKDGAVLFYRNEPTDKWTHVAFISAEVLRPLAKALLTASFIAEGPEP